MRTTHVRFTVTGLNEKELVEKAEAEIVRFYGMAKMHTSFAYTIDAEPLYGWNAESQGYDTIIGFKATVSA